MKPMIRRQRVFYVRASCYDALVRLSLQRVRRPSTAALATLDRIARFYSLPGFTVCAYRNSRISPSRTRSNLHAVLMSSSSSSARSSLQKEPAARNISYPSLKPSPCDAGTPTRDADLNVHEPRLRSGQDNYIAHLRGNIDGNTATAGGVYSVTGQDTSHTPFRPSPRMMMRSFTTCSQKNSTLNQPAAVTDDAVQFNVASQPDSDMEEIEEHIPLSFQIPPQVMEAALKAPEGTKASYWSQQLYRGPNGEEIQTHHCITLEMSERVAKYFVDEKVLGFDIEWKKHANPISRKQNVSLIQIASETRIALFQIALFSGFRVEQLVPPTLKKILESPDILKVGVAVKADFTRVRTFLGIQARGVMELSRTHNLVLAEDPSTAGNKLSTLALQVKTHLQLPLYKGEPLVDDPEPEDEKERVQWLKRQSVRTSDWSKKLEPAQIFYAAADAYAGVRLYDVLEFKRKQFKPPRPLPQLCDYDAPTKPKPSPKAKKASAKRMSDEKEAEMIREALLGMSIGEEEEKDAQERGTTAKIMEEDLQANTAAAEAEEEDTQEYQTAVEELEDETEEDIETDESSESEEGADPDGEYIPRQSDLPDMSDDVGGAERSSPARTRYIGRLDLSKLRGPDPGYPKLPELSPDEFPATELSQDHVQQHVANKNENKHHPFNGTHSEELDEEMVHDEDALEGLVHEEDSTESVVHNEECDEFSDSELEEALNHVEIDEIAQTTQEAQQGDTLSSNEPAPNTNLITITTEVAQSNPNHPTTSHPPAYATATAWAQDYLDSTIPSVLPSPEAPPTPHIRATITHLRAYHMWHIQQLPVATIGPLLRNPPLAPSTVANYIMQAVSLERLAYDETRLRDLLGAMPRGLRVGRWKVWSAKVGALEECS